MLWDASRLPVRDGMIDAIVSDMPFGKRMGTKSINKEIYPLLLQQFHR